MIRIVLFLLLLASQSGYSQGQVTFNVAPSIDQMMDQYITTNKSKDYINGWRIQIITTNDRRKMEHAKAKFQSYYPGIPIKWKHEEPYYRLRVGAYETKVELMGFLLELKKDFSGVIPVRDQIPKFEIVSF